MNEDDEEVGIAGLYVTDAEIIRRLGFGLKKGYRIIHELDRPRPHRRRYPQPDPLFANRRFWPAVYQWHLDYHLTRAPAEPHHAPSEQPRWMEQLDAYTTPKTSKAGRPGHPRPELAAS